MNKCFNRQVRLFVVGLALLFPSVLLAAVYDPSMPAEPARLTDKPSSLQNRIQFPSITEDVFVVVLCNAVISYKGKFEAPVYCYRDEGIEDSLKPPRIRASQRTIEVGPDVEVTEVVGRSFDWYEERFEREVVEAARISRLEPARLQGRRVEVKINFAVRFTQEKGERNIDVFLNHFRNLGRLGTDYIAAQRFNEQKRMFQSERPNECPVLHIPVWVRSIVMINGSAYNVKVDKVGRREEVSEESVDRCLEAFMTQVKDTLFVPTIHDGRYVSAHYTELFYDDKRDENSEMGTAAYDRILENFQNRGGSMFEEVTGPKQLRDQLRAILGRDRVPGPD